MRRPARGRKPPPRPASGQAAVEACIVLALASCLACPCCEFGRMALDRMAASQAAGSIASLAAERGGIDEESFLAASFPHISEVADARVSISPATRKNYSHHLSYGDGLFKDRDSTLTYRTVEATVTVAREFVTPMGSLFSTFLGTEGYRVEGKGVAVKDESALSGDW